MPTPLPIAPQARISTPYLATPMNKTDSDALFGHYSKLIGLIYQAAASPESWPELMHALEQHCLHYGRDHQQTRLLEPHFTQAIQLDQKITQLQYRNRLFDHLINHLPLGLMIVDRHARMLMKNQRTDPLFAAGGLLKLCNGTVQSGSETQTRALHLLIDECARGNIDPLHNTLMLSDPASDQLASICVTPAEAGVVDPEPDQNHVALYISSPMIRPVYDTGILRDSFALTTAEARLVKRLANGCHNLNEAADSLGVSPNTVRSQIKTVFGKTNTSSQVELLKKVFSHPAILLNIQKQPPPSTAPSNVQGQATSITLPDNRQFGFCQFGNSEATPLVYCHALVHADQQFLHLPDMDKTLPYRIISPKRPGFLRSTWKRSALRSLKQHAEDIIQLMDALDIHTFKVAGYSSGTPYAAALAYYFPQRVESLTLIATMVPPELDRLDLLTTTDRLMLQLAVKLPNLIRDRVSHVTLKSLNNNPDELVARNADKLSTHEKEILQSSAFSRYLQTWANQSYPSRAACVAEDLMVRSRPWGFNPADIQLPVELWHAEDDSTVDISCAKKLAALFPDCKTHWLKQGGHYIFFSQYQRIFS